MRNRILSTVVAALLAPALLASGAAKDLFACKPATMACCKHEVPSAPTVTRATPRCCELRPGTAKPVQLAQAPSSSPALVLVAMVQAPLPVLAQPPPRTLPPPPDPLPQRSPLQATCTLLI